MTSSTNSPYQTKKERVIHITLTFSPHAHNYGITNITYDKITSIIMVAALAKHL